jgi:Tfp pilus assembly protein PilV
MSSNNTNFTFNQKFNSCSAGFTTLEILIALAIITTGISTVVLVVFGNQSAVSDSYMNSEALQKASGMMERARAGAMANYSLLQTVATSSDGGYKENVTVQMKDEFTKLVTSTVSWQTDHGRSEQVSLVTLLVDWQNAMTGNTCNTPLTGDWRQPKSTSYLFGQDLVLDNATTTAISDMQERGQKLYVSLNVAATKGSAKFFVFDLAQGGKPSLLGSLNNSTSTTAGISAMAVAGNYAYLASSRAISAGSGFGQLQIVDISNASRPQLVKTYKVANVTGTSGQGVGNSIFYSKGYVFLGLTKTGSGPEFIIIDVRDPVNPLAVGNFIVSNAVNKILVKGNYAYIAHPTDSSSQPPEQVTVLDISDPTSPRRISGFHSLDNQGNGKSLFIMGNNLYVGRTVTTTANPELYIIDNTDPTAITSSYFLSSQKISNSVNSLAVRNNLIFMVTNNQLQIWDAVDPGRLLSYASPISLPGGPGTAISCSGNLVYISSVSSSGTGYVSVVSPGT